MVKVKKLGVSKTGYKVRIVSECSSKAIGSRVEAYSVQCSKWFQLYPILGRAAQSEVECYVQYGKALNS